MKKISIVDIIIVVGVILALLVGVCTAKRFRQTADKQIEAISPITFQVFLRGVTVTGEEFPIKLDEKTFITYIYCFGLFCGSWCSGYKERAGSKE